jgi:hypothetical protein
MIVLALSALAAGQQEPIPHSAVASRQASDWRNQIDLGPVLSDSEAMKRLVIIYRPSYRQTLFVFGAGRLVLQTYPDNFFNQSDSLLPTCTANVDQSELRDTDPNISGALVQPASEVIRGHRSPEQRNRV